MLLRPLDVVVSVQACLMPSANWTIAQMAEALGLGTTQVFRATKQAATATLLIGEALKGRVMYRPHRAALVEFLVHGIRYAMAPQRGGLTRGLPTAHAAPILSNSIASSDPAPVWPLADGKIRGEAFEPLHECVPLVARKNANFYAAMALIDALRSGRARERQLATKLMPEALHARS